MTPKQQRFAEEYLIDLNATAAYRRAGYAAMGNAAEVNAARLLRNAQVQAAVSEAQAERSRKTGIDAAWLLERLAAEAIADVSDLYTDDGRIKSVKDWPLIWRQGLVAGMEVETIGEGSGHLTKVKLSDRIKRLELIGKHIDVQAFKEKIEHSGAMTVVVSPEDAGL